MPSLKREDVTFEELIQRLTRIENLLATIVDLLDAISEKIAEDASRARSRHVGEVRTTTRGEENAEVIWRGRKERPKRSQQKRTAYDILRDEGVMFESDLRNITYKDKLFASLRNKGAVIIETDRERIATTEEYLNDLLEKIRGKTPDEAIDELRGKDRRLYEALREAGYLIYKRGKWILDLSE